MRGYWWLRKTAQYSLVYRRGKLYTNNMLILKARCNGLSYSRYGFSISRKVGNAVKRNRIKRILREIFASESLSRGWDIVVIARPEAARADYQRLSRNTKELLQKSGLVYPNIKFPNTETGCFNDSPEMNYISSELK